MIRRVVSFIILVPLGILIVLFAITNRGPVTISFDPLAAEPPMLRTSVPLFFVILAALIAGVVIGGVASWARQGERRRRARALGAELKASRAETDALRRQLEASAAAQAQAQTSLASIAYRPSSAA
jgi:uncharacterized integral membrane protein